MNQRDSNNLPDYKKPPVVEVVCGISFKALEKFRGQHLGLFWQKVRNEFPVCEHAPRMEFNPQNLDLAKYLPRIWFINEKSNMLIQLQDDKFFFNWRRVRQEEDYPRYNTIIKAFKINLRTFQDFLESEMLGSIDPTKCELTYINHIPKGEGWESLEDINLVFNDFSWSSKERFLPPPISLAGQALFSLPKNKGHLNITLQHGERKLIKNQILIFQLTANGLGEDKSMDAVWEWFEVAHEWIVCGFTDLTGKKIQKDIWQRIDGN